MQTANLPLVDFITYPFVVLSSDDISFLSVLALKMSLKNTLNAFCIAFGIFVIWMGIFYWLAKPSGKAVMDKLIWILCGAAIVDYMFFGTGSPS